MKNNKSSKEIDSEKTINRTDFKNYKPFRPKNLKYSHISKIDFDSDIYNNTMEKNYIIQNNNNLTQRFDNNRIEALKIYDLNPNTNSEKILYNFNDNNYT